MQKCLIKILFVSLLLPLVSCQSNPTNPHIFRPFTQTFAPSTNVAQSVQDALMRNEDPVIANVHVETTRYDSVILTGYVKKIRQSDVAEQISRQVPGVRSVENRIIVRP